MKRLRRWMTVFSMAVAIGIPAYAGEPDGLGPFADTDGSVHEDDVAALWAAGITTGCDEWLFCPEDPVTRGEMAALLSRSLELETPAARSFLDTVGSAFAAEIEALALAGITDGCGARRFCPDEEVSRAQMASFLVGAFGLPVGAGHDFDDVAGNAHEAAIAALADSGITRGCGETAYCPGRSVTRQQIASFLSRALGLDPPAEMPEIPADVRESLEEPSWPTGPGAEGWRELVERHFAPGDADRAVRIMHCESRGEPDARNPYSGASGLFQHMPRYWPERSAAAGFAGESIFDPVANVAVAAWLVYDYSGGGWHHWVCQG